jgi:pantoate--beta-alanine ligase
MKIVRQIDEIVHLCATIRAEGETIGLVPTMGALHEGHLSLLRKSRQLSDRSILSIFVNPTQFGPGEDLDKYPRPFEADCELAEKNGCDIVFAPVAEAVYPRFYATFVQVEGITQRLCGASRPGHFRGVTTVVMKFFNIISPRIAVFGQKDAQQVIVLRRMVEDLSCPVKIIVEPTIREKDGLAMSSRNRYLTDAERSQAPLLYQGLAEAAKLHASGEQSASRLHNAIAAVYRRATLLTPEYVEIVDVKTLEPLLEIGDRALVAVAARTKETGTRLIDNVMLGGDL